MIIMNFIVAWRKLIAVASVRLKKEMPAEIRKVRVGTLRLFPIMEQNICLGHDVSS